jgi:ABC-2 type transport system ATP-binding protein
MMAFAVQVEGLVKVYGGRIVARGRGEELKRSLGGEVVTLAVEKAALRPGLLQDIRRLSFVRGVFEDGGLSVLVSDAESALPQLMSLLKGEGVPVERVSITKPTLDDVFLKSVGERLEGGGRISDVRCMRDRIRRG